MKTLCKYCDDCVEYTYRRTTRADTLVYFKYCNGNKFFIEEYEYSISHPNSKKSQLKILRSRRYGTNDDKINKTPTSYMKKERNTVVTHLNGNKFDLKLKNLREMTWRCLFQERKSKKKTSIFPGVTFKENKYFSKITKDKKLFYLGSFDNEMDAYHAYVLKCEEFGSKINKETEAHKIYLEEYDSSNFIPWEKKKRASHFKNVTKEYDKFIAIGVTEEGKRKYIAKFDNEIDAFHAYVLWSKLNDKEVDTENMDYQEFLKEENPAMNLDDFINSRRKKPTSKYRNICFYKQTNKWLASFSKNGKCAFRKYFDDEYEAHLAVEKERKKLGLE